MYSGQPIRLVLFSGLASNADVFIRQKLAFPQLEVPQWLLPEKTDTLDSYARRLAEFLASDQPIVLGGASFGGIIALHAAQYLKPQAIILIGSIRSASELPRYAQWARALRMLVRWLPLKTIQWLLAPLASRWAHQCLPALSELSRQIRTADPRVVRWSLERVLDWQSTPEVHCPIVHIHGSRDKILPLRFTTADRTVVGGGHLIALTHADQVNKFIGETLARVQRETG